MKIAVFHNLPPGGGRKSLFKIIEKLKKRKHTIDTYTLDFFNDNFYEIGKISDNNFIYKIKKSPYLYRLLFQLKNVQKKIAYHIDNKNYDLVFVNPCIITQSPYILRFLNTPSFYLCQEPNREFYEKTSFSTHNYFQNIKKQIIYLFRLPIKFIDLKNIKYSSYIITNSQFSSKKVKEIYNLSSKVIYLGVDSEKYRPIKKLKNNIISVGSFNYLKGHHWIIKALNKNLPNLDKTLLIVGYDGNEEDHIYKIAKQSNIKIKFYKKVSEKKLIELYNSSLVYVNGSYFEPFGLTLIESMACETPVLSVNEGGPSEIIKQNENGILVKRDTKRFTNTLNDLLKDQKQLYFLGKNAREYVKQNFSWEQTAIHFEKFFETKI